MDKQWKECTHTPKPKCPVLPEDPSAAQAASKDPYSVQLLLLLFFFMHFILMFYGKKVKNNKYFYFIKRVMLRHALRLPLLPLHSSSELGAVPRG
jgi:hypothetical protein